MLFYYIIVAQFENCAVVYVRDIFCSREKMKPKGDKKKHCTMYSMALTHLTKTCRADQTELRFMYNG